MVGYEEIEKNLASTDLHPARRQSEDKILVRTGAVPQSDISNSEEASEVAVVDDSMKVEEKLVVRTQDENYSWKSFDSSCADARNVRDTRRHKDNKSENESRPVSIKGTAKFRQQSETDTENNEQCAKRTAVLRDEIVSLDHEIGELHKNLGQESSPSPPRQTQDA